MKKRAMAILLTAMMLLGMPSCVFAAASWDAAPTVGLLASNIEGSGGASTLELSIVVSNSNFKALGAALEYDANVVQPIDWTTTGAAVNLTSATDWQTAAIVESKCPDNLSGKPAYAYQNDATHKGYLYMGAESAVAQDIAEQAKVVTVRFGYVGNSTFSAVQADTIKFATGEQAFKSPVKGSMIYQSENRATGDSKFFYLNPLKETADGSDYEVDSDLSDSGSIGGEGGGGSTPGAIVPEGDGETVNTGKADASSFVSVAFYDWDDTLLGTRILAKGDSLIDPNTAENKDNAEYQGKTDAELAAMKVAPVAPSGETLTSPATDSDGNPITTVNKAGYEFAGWVDYNTGSSTPMVNVDVDGLQNIDNASLISLENMEESRVLKAAYNEKGMGEYFERQYTITNSPFKSGGLGLQTTFTVVRTETTRRGDDGAMELVIDLRPRLRGQTRVVVPLGAKDIETFTFDMPSNASSQYEAANALSYTVKGAVGGEVKAFDIDVPSNTIVHHN